MSSSAPSVLFRVGDFVVDPARAEIRRRGGICPMQPRAFALLLYLIRHRDRVVPGEELLANLWPGVHVCRDSLTFAVRTVRRSLGDDGRTQAIIANRRGHGYWLAAPVDELHPPQPHVCRFCGAGRERDPNRAFA